MVGVPRTVISVEMVSGENDSQNGIVERRDGPAASQKPPEMAEPAWGTALE
jgi:hypothetical protein